MIFPHPTLSFGVKNLFGTLISRLKKIQEMDSAQDASYKAGEVKGQAQEKGGQMMDKASNAAQSAKDSIQEAGQQAMAKAQGAADAVKDAANK